MRYLTIDIQIDEGDTAPDILELLIGIMDGTNDRGYPIVRASVGDTEIFGCRGLSEEFFRGARWREGGDQDDGRGQDGKDHI